MIKFITCLIGWFLLPLVIVAVAWEITKCWVEHKLND